MILIPRGRPIVVAPNHLSELDPVFILVVIFRFRRFRILAKQELFRNPFVAWFLRCMGQCPSTAATVTWKPSTV